MDSFTGSSAATASSTSTTSFQPEQVHQPFYIFNFDFNPHTSVFAPTFLIATILQIFGFYFTWMMMPSLSKNRRGLSWVLTFFSSIVLFSGAFTMTRHVHFSSKVEYFGWGIDRLLPSWTSSSSISKQPYAISMKNYPQESDLAIMYSAYFISYLICDLSIGMIHYKSLVDPISGWVHHLVYLWVISNATFHKNVSTFFCIGTPLEVSTIVLGIGHIVPRYRNDGLFAMTFFISRIVYPLILIPELYYNVEMRLAWKVGAAALTMHLHWFQKFVQQQWRYHQKRQQAKQDKNGSSVSVDGKLTVVGSVKKDSVNGLPSIRLVKSSVEVVDQVQLEKSLGFKQADEEEGEQDFAAILRRQKKSNTIQSRGNNIQQGWTSGNMLSGDHLSTTTTPLPVIRNRSAVIRGSNGINTKSRVGLDSVMFTRPSMDESSTLAESKTMLLNAVELNFAALTAAAGATNGGGGVQVEGSGVMNNNNGATTTGIKMEGENAEEVLLGQHANNFLNPVMRGIVVG